MDVLIVILILLVVIIFSCIKVVPQASTYVIERIGSYYVTCGNGLHFKLPFIDRIANRVSLK